MFELVHDVSNFTFVFYQFFVGRNIRFFSRSVERHYQFHTQTREKYAKKSCIRFSMVFSESAKRLNVRTETAVPAPPSSVFYNNWTYRHQQTHTYRGKIHWRTSLISIVRPFLFIVHISFLFTRSFFNPFTFALACMRSLSDLMLLNALSYFLFLPSSVDNSRLHSTQFTQ